MLTARQVATEKRRGMHADGGNLYLRVGPSGSRSWIFRYCVNGRRRDMGLGPVSLIPLAEARETVIDLRRGLRKGIDPIDQQRATRPVKTVTFAEAAEAYYAKFSPEFTSVKHAKQWRSSMVTHVYPVIGKMPITSIDTPAVLEVLNADGFWLGKAATANRCRGRIESIMDYAATAGLRPKGPNPAAWRGHLENLLPKPSKVQRVAHHAAMPFADLPAFMAQLRARNSIAAKALEFTILTAARTGETLGARWSEIDLERRVWVIPPERMKMRKEHRVPLSGRALAILDDMAKVRVNDRVFPGQFAGANKLGETALLLLMRQLGRKEMVHGFRSTFRTWLAEETSFPSELGELALAHAIGDKTERAYLRSDQFERRRQLAEAWAAACDSAERTDNIRHLRTAAN